MNKQKRLQQLLIKQGGIALGIVVFCAVIYYFTGTLADSSAQKKTDADAKLTADQSQITSLGAQLDKSGVAEKQYLELQKSRDNDDFSSNSDTLKDWLRNAKSQYRLSNTFKLSITTPKPATNSEFSGLNYEVVEHPAMKLEFTAISDTHTFSFLTAFLRQAPGFIRIDSLEMKRVGDLDSNTINQIKSGSAPYLVDTKIEFDWIGVNEKSGKDKDGKDTKDAAAPEAASAAPAAGGAATVTPAGTP